MRGLHRDSILAARWSAPPPRPIATGWSDSCRAGFAPAEGWCLSTAHYYVVYAVVVAGIRPEHTLPRLASGKRLPPSGRPARVRAGRWRKVSTISSGDCNRAADALFQSKEFPGTDPWVGLERAESMPRNDRRPSGTGSKSGASLSDARRTRSIRFSDSEWSLIERAAARHGIPAGELVRSGTVAAAEDRLGEPPLATLSKGHAALIEAIYRSAYMMATLKRDELLDAERAKELDDLVAAARRTMAETMDEGPA